MTPRSHRWWHAVADQAADPDAPADPSVGATGAADTGVREPWADRAMPISGLTTAQQAVLAGLDVNIEAFDTRIGAEPHSGAPLFHLAASLRLPPGRPAADVQSALEAISAEIMVDLALTAA